MNWPILHLPSLWKDTFFCKLWAVPIRKCCKGLHTVTVLYVEQFQRVCAGLCAFFFYLFWFTQYKIIRQPNGEGTREVPLAEDCSAAAPVSGRGVNIEPSVNQALAIISNTLKQNSINLLFGFFNIHKNIFLEAAGIAVRGRTANIHIFSLWLEYLHQILYYEGWRTRKAHSASYVMAQSLSGRANNGTIIQADIFFVSNIFCFFVSVCA